METIDTVLMGSQDPVDYYRSVWGEILSLELSLEAYQYIQLYDFHVVLTII